MQAERCSTCDAGSIDRLIDWLIVFFFCQPDRCLFDPKSSQPDGKSTGKPTKIQPKTYQNRPQIGPGSALGRLGPPKHRPRAPKSDPGGPQGAPGSPQDPPGSARRVPKGALGGRKGRPGSPGGTPKRPKSTEMPLPERKYRFSVEKHGRRPFRIDFCVFFRPKTVCDFSSCLRQR
jgi:hypothetical protein